MCVKEDPGTEEANGREREGERERGGGGGRDTFVLLISVLKDAITSHSILSMFYMGPELRVSATSRPPPTYTPSLPHSLCKAHNLTLAVTVYFTKENCPGEMD